MNSEFNRFDFFTKSEMTLVALKFRNKNEKFKKILMALPRQEKDNFLYKFYHAFILHEDKENQEELIAKALSGIKSDKEAHKAGTEKPQHMGNEKIILQ